MYLPIRQERFSWYLSLWTVICGMSFGKTLESLLGWPHFQSDLFIFCAISDKIKYKLPPTRIKEYFEMLLRGLHFLHEKWIIHRG